MAANGGMHARNGSMGAAGLQQEFEPKVDVLSDEVMLLSHLVPRHVADTITANTVTANIAPELSTVRMQNDTVMIQQATPTAVLDRYKENVLHTQQGPRMRAGKVKKLGAGGFGVVWLCKVKGVQVRAACPLCAKWRTGALCVRTLLAGATRSHHYCRNELGFQCVRLMRGDSMHSHSCVS